MDVFQILIFLVIIGVGLFKTLRKRQLQTTRRKVVRKTVPVNPFPLEEEMPEKEEMPEEEEMPEKVQMTPSPEVRKKKHVLKQEKQRKKESSEKPVPVQGKPSEEHPSGYAFRTPSDARRAFIYSEIFRRKYD